MQSKAQGFLFTAVCTLLSLQRAEAAPAWSAPVELSAPVVLLNLQFEGSVALDASGNAVAVWNANGLVQAASQARGGAWSTPPVPIGAQGDYEEAYEPRVGLGPGATALAVWTSATRIPDQQPVYAIKAAKRSKSGQWSAPMTVRLVRGVASVGGPRLALDGVGNAVVAWLEWDGVRTSVRVSTKPAQGNAWSAPVTISGADWEAQALSLAVNPAGAALVAWQASDVGGAGVIQASTRAAGGAWGAAVTISAAAGQSFAPKVAMDKQGRGLAVWNDSSVITAVALASNGQWSAPVELSSAELPCYGAPDLAMDTLGNGLAAWSDGQARVASYSPGVGWSQPSALSRPDEYASEPRVSVSPTGALRVVSWTDDNQNLARAATRASQPRWSVNTLGTGLYDTPVEVSANGTKARAFWSVGHVSSAQWWVPAVSGWGQ